MPSWFCRLASSSSSSRVEHQIPLAIKTVNLCNCDFVTHNMGIMLRLISCYGCQRMRFSMVMISQLGTHPHTLQLSLNSSSIGFMKIIVIIKQFTSSIAKLRFFYYSCHQWLSRRGRWMRINYVLLLPHRTIKIINRRACGIISGAREGSALLLHPTSPHQRSLYYYYFHTIVVQFWCECGNTLLYGSPTWMLLVGCTAT